MMHVDSARIITFILKNVRNSVPTIIIIIIIVVIVVIVATSVIIINNVKINNIIIAEGRIKFLINNYHRCECV